MVFVNGDAGRPLFITQGAALPYRIVALPNGKQFVEPITSCLPTGALHIMLKELAGVDMKIFERWAVSLVSDCQSLTSGGRKVLLIYDGYRSHMGIEVLEILKTGGNIAYALPAHTSGLTQPLDVGVFGPFKQHLNRLIHEASEACAASPMDLLDLMKLMRSAYECAFTRSNINRRRSRNLVFGRLILQQF